MQKPQIEQEVVLSCSSKYAYDAWLDSNTHGAMIGAEAEVEPKVGGEFSIWDGYLVGKTLELHSNPLKIVQSWRDTSSGWPDYHYSTIEIEFLPHGKKGTLIKFAQNGVPEKFVESIEQGWKDFYWDKMKEYFD